jgi:hypothetical protein
MRRYPWVILCALGVVLGPLLMLYAGLAGAWGALWPAAVATVAGVTGCLTFRSARRR